MMFENHSLGICTWNTLAVFQLIPNYAKLTGDIKVDQSTRSEALTSIRVPDRCCPALSAKG